MVYQRRVVKRRTATLTDAEWLLITERGKLPRPGVPDVWSDHRPPPDVYDLVFARELSELRWRVEQLCMALQKPSTSPPSNGSLSSVANPGQLLAVFSELWDFLTKPSYGDGTKRQTGQVSVKLSSGGIQVTLTDPTSASYCCLTAPTLDDAFLGLEMGLKDGTLAWRASGYARAKK